MVNLRPEFLLICFRQICLSAFMLLFKADLKAQDTVQRITQPIYVHSSFFYDFPQSFGASVGTTFPISSKKIIAEYKDGKKLIKYRDLIVSGDFGFYRYAFNNSGIYFFQSIGKRYQKEKPYYFDWLIRLGALCTFYDGLVYTVNDNGDVSVLKDFGRYYAVTGFTAVFGHDFDKNKNPKHFLIEIKPALWVQYPYNSFVLPHFSVEATFQYHFKSFNIGIKQKQVTQLLNK